MDEEKFNLKKSLFSRIDRKLTLLFIIVAIVAPTLGIYYFYIIATSIMPESLFAEQTDLLKTAAIFVICVIAIDAGIIGFIVSRSISKPIKELYKATKEVECGNFNVRTDIKTNDEIEELSHAFNNTTTALSRMDEERKQIIDEFATISSRTPNNDNIR